MNRTILSILAIAVLAVACDTAESPLDVGGATAAGTHAAAAVERNDEGVRDLVHTIEEAWIAKDAALYASIYADDFDGISPVGGLTSGRAAIQALHAFLFAGNFANSSQTVVVRRIEFLTGTYAIVDLTTTLTGFAVVPPGLTAIDGALVSRVRWVVAKNGPRWEVIASQITPLPF